MKKKNIKYLFIILFTLFISFISTNVFAANILNENFKEENELASKLVKDSDFRKKFVTCDYKEILGKTFDMHIGSNNDPSTISYVSASCIDNRHNTIKSANVKYRILNIIDIGATNKGRSLAIYKYKKGQVRNVTGKNNAAILAGARGAVYMDEIFNHPTKNNAFYKDMLINVLCVIQKQYKSDFYSGIRVAFNRPSDTKHSYYSNLNKRRSDAKRITASKYSNLVNKKKLPTDADDIESISQESDTTSMTPVYKTVIKTNGKKGKKKKTWPETVLDYYLIGPMSAEWDRGPMSAEWDRGTLSTVLKINKTDVTGYYVCNSKGKKKKLSSFKNGKNFYIRYDTDKEIAQGTNVVFKIKQGVQTEGYRARLLLLGTYSTKKNESTHNHQNLGIFAETSITSDGDSVQWQVNAQNKLVIKKIGENGEAVPNVTFDVYCNNVLICQRTTGADGLAVLENAQPGEYYVVEKSVGGQSAYSAQLQGYPRSDVYKVSASDTEDIVIEMEQTSRTNLKIHKTVKNNPNVPIPNAVFKIQYRENQTDDWQWISGYDPNQWELDKRVSMTYDANQAMSCPTDANGNYCFISMPVGYYQVVEISVPEPYVLKPQTLVNGSYVLWNNNTSPEHYCGPISDEDMKTDPYKNQCTFECADPQIFKISGYLFTPVKNGKDESTVDTHGSSYQQGDRVIENGTVKLLRDGVLYEATSDGEVAGVLTTNQNGRYEYVVEMGYYNPQVGESEYVNRFSVQFVYDGIDFIAMSPNYNDPIAPNAEELIKPGATSKAAEENGGDVRKKYDPITGVENPQDPSTSDVGYGTVQGGNKENLTYDWKSGEGNEGTTGTSTSIIRDYQTGYEVLDNEHIRINANKDEVKNQVSAKFAMTGAYGNYQRYSIMIDGHVSKITQINLGLITREKPDLQLVNSLENVETDINGFPFVYAKTRGRKQETNVGVTYVADSELSNFTIYKSDGETVEANPNDDRRLKLYVTYRIELVNNAETLYSKAHEIALFYDTNYTISSIGTSLGGNRRANDDLKDKISSESAIRSTRSQEGKYNISYVNTDALMLNKKDGYTDGSNIKYIYVTYQVSDSEIINMLEKQNENYTPKFKNIAEINSYTTYEDENATTVYAGIDKNSAPGNVPDSIDLNGDETRAEMTPKFDNDTGYAEEFTIKLKDNRTLEGQIFLDESTGGIGKERTSDGLYDTSKEYAMEGVKIELQEVKFDENGNLIVENGKPVALTDDEALKRKEALKIEYATKENDYLGGLPKGSYKITGYIPGYYVLKYEYNNDTYYVDTNGNKIGNINALDYKAATISNANKDSHGGEYTTSNKTGNVTWYLSDNPSETDKIVTDNNTSTEQRINLLRENSKTKTKYTEAIDNWVTRNGLDTSKITIETSNQDFRIDSKMDAYTPVFAINVELNTVSADNQFLPKGYNIFNMDMGITERAKQELKANKEVSNIKITLANGQVLLEGNPKDKKLFKKMSGVKYIPENTMNKNGTINIELDSELIHGSRLEITYKITVNNVGEKDYYNQKYYNYGLDGNDKTNEVLITPQVYDYVDNRLTFEKDMNNGWEVVKKNEMQTKNDNNQDISLISDANGTIGKTNTILHYNGGEYNGISAGENKSTEVVLVRTLSNNNDDSLTYDNNAEVVWGNKNKGRRFNIQVGTYMDSTDENHIGDSSETVTITPPTGENRDYAIYIITGIGALLVLAGGIIIIKKKVLK